MSTPCSIDYYFPTSQKRLMRSRNSTRKVNTILKCQEINDIVFFSFSPMVLQSRVTNVLPFSLSPSLLVISSSHLSLDVPLFLSLTCFVFVCFCFYYSLIFPHFLPSFSSPLCLHPRSPSAATVFACTLIYIPTT